MHDNHALIDRDLVGEMASLMRLLGDPTRIRVLGLLRNGERNVSALCGKLDLAQPTVSHHLGLLRTAGLVLTRREGKQVFYSLNPRHLRVCEGGGGIELSFGAVRMLLGASESGDAGDGETQLATAGVAPSGVPSAAAC